MAIEIGDKVRRRCGSRRGETGVVTAVNRGFCFVFSRWFHWTTLEVLAENSNIEWTDDTFNPWRGCQKVSLGCKNCYAETRGNRFGEDFSGQRIVLSDKGWKEPLKWNKFGVCTNCGGQTLPNNFALTSGISQCCDAPIRKRRVFCASLADVFEDWDGPMHNHDGSLHCVVDELPATIGDVRHALFKLIDATPNLDWLLLTKRPENVRAMWPEVKSSKPIFPGAPGALGKSLPCYVRGARRKNVWLGTTVENQEQADIRIPELLKCRYLASKLFLSCEPLLGPLQLDNLKCPSCHGNKLLKSGKMCGTCVATGRCTEFLKRGIDWIIAGGESGPNARPSHPNWYRSIRDQCKSADVPFHFKQWGDWLPAGQGAPPHDWTDETKWEAIVKLGICSLRVGKKKAGRVLDGVEHNGFPVSPIEGVS